MDPAVDTYNDENLADLFKAEGSLAALTLFAMVVTADNWISRRVETMHFFGGASLTRCVSLDFTIPNDFRPDIRAASGKQYIVPLTVLSKQKLRNFSLRLDGKSAPVLTREQNTRVSQGMARWAGRWALDEVDEASNLSEELADLLDRIVGQDADQAGEAFEGLFELAPVDVGAKHVVENELVMELLSALVSSYVMYAVLDLPHKRTVAKFEHDELFAREELSFRGRSRQFLFGAFGYAPPIEIPTPSASFANSYHCEVVVPDELRIAAAILQDVDAIEPDDYFRDLDVNVDRASLHAASAATLVHPEVLLLLQAERHGFPTVAAFIASATSVLLLAGASVDSIGGTTSSPAVAVLSATSALYASWLVRTDEHPLVGKFFLAPRLLLILAAAASVVASAALAFNAEGCTLRSIWFGCGVVASLSALALIRLWWKSAPSLAT